MTKVQSPDLQTFRITTQHEAEIFENFLNKYCRDRLRINDDLIKPPYIGKLYSVGEETQSQRLFWAAIDLELTYIFLARDTGIAGMTHNQINAAGKAEVPSVFSDSALFASKLDVLCAYTSLAYRCRAWWDKFMGVLILMYAEGKYDRYMGGKSRAKAFKRIAVEWKGFSPQLHSAFKNMLRTLLIHAKRKLMEETDFHGHSNEKQLEYLRNTEISEIIQDFESSDLEYETILGFIGDIIDSLNEIRTAETHGTGMLRKWSLGSVPLSQSRDASLDYHYNVVNEIMHAIRQTLYEFR